MSIILHPPKATMNAVTHQLADFLRLIGMRDRLRCPSCRAVGTWKPHGGWLDRDDDRPRRRRWMCKWCGYYIGPEGHGHLVAVPALGDRWIFRNEDHTTRTPEQIVRRYYSEEISPWRG